MCFLIILIYDTLTAARITPLIRHKRAKKNEHPSRSRKEREGELVQIDATPCQWFKKWGDTQYYALHVALDNATGKVVGMYMTQNECSHGYFELLRQILTHYGKPIAFYSDRSAIFHPTNKAKLSIEEQLEGCTRPRTHWEKIMEDLDTASILANSPKAKGRVERMWGTHQQDLLFDIQDKMLKTVDEVNAYSPAYIAKFNDAFSVEQSGEGVAWRKAGQHWNDKICKRYLRTVDMGNCVSFMNYRLQIDVPLKRNVKVEIRVAENKLCAYANGRNYSVHLVDGTKQQDIKVRKMISLCLFRDEKCG